MSKKHRVYLGIIAAAAGLALVLALLSSFLGFPAAVGVLRAGQFRLEGVSRTQWLVNGKSYRVPVQSWRHVESGALLKVEFARFPSSDLAAAACEHEVRCTAAMATAGTFSGEAVGDQSWHWLIDGAARLLFRSGSCVVSLHISGSPPEDVTTVLEDVASRIQRYIR